MSNIIEVSNLSKSYSISHESKERYTALRDVMARKAKTIFSFPVWKARPVVTKEEFWALKNVSFDIEQGDRIGIIGRNGAGKSTLLKILSRITEPTGGSIRIRGRVASLLEVGTGFHPELTGRENIFLNGAILGMSRVEIKRHFDAIVDFSEIEKFLDTPVKRYSSGMYVRLAFAVAAHLEPEILVVDEVLAVGDAQFQKKCLGKMEDVSRNEGRTVLFVSHNMNVVKVLCNKGILLSHGMIADKGDMDKMIQQYLNVGDEDIAVEYSHKEGGKLIRIVNVLTCGERKPLLRIGSDLDFRIQYKVINFRGEVEFFLLIFDAFGECVQGIFQADNDEYLRINEEEGTLTLRIPNNLIPGKYLVSVGCFDKYRNFLDWVEHCEQFEIDVLYGNDRLFQPRLGRMMSKKAEWISEQ